LYWTRARPGNEGVFSVNPVVGETNDGRLNDIRRRTETVGRAMPCIEVKVADPKTGLALPPGVQGEVCCRGYNVMKGYYRMPEATAKAIDDEGWLHSGDLGVLDADGYLAITGRLKDMIIRGGENIYPREIEEYLFKLEGVADVQVVGVPHRKYGEEVGAFIRLKQNAALTEQDVKDYCRGRISRYKIPRHVAFVDRYPMTASGKIQKYKLVEMSRQMFPPEEEKTS